MIYKEPTVDGAILDKVESDISEEDKGEALINAVACTVGKDQSGLVCCILK